MSQSFISALLLRQLFVQHDGKVDCLLIVRGEPVHRSLCDGIFEAEFGQQGQQVHVLTFFRACLWHWQGFRSVCFFHRTECAFWRVCL